MVTLGSFKLRDVGVNETTKANREKDSKNDTCLAQGRLDLPPADVSHIHPTAVLHSEYSLHEHEEGVQGEPQFEYGNAIA